MCMCIYIYIYTLKIQYIYLHIFLHYYTWKSPGFTLEGHSMSWMLLKCQALLLA